MSTSTTSEPSPQESPDGTYSNVNAEWPLRFKAHYFDTSTYSTYGCKVRYGNYVTDEPDDELQSSSEAIGAKYPNNMTAGWGPITNFPAAAAVEWRSKDGAPHEAEIDIGEIFKDELIRHNVAREDAAEPATDGTPEIILEVNDRAINVYMRATIWTKKEQIPGNRYSNSREDLIKVFSQTY